MAEGSALKAMTSFFTIWRRDITEDDMEAMNRKFHLVPIVGALIGLIVLIEAVILAYLSKWGIFGSSLFAAVFILGTVYVGSRFLHFDGLADFGDGSVVAGTQEDHVRALKDTLIGAGGLGVALIATLMNVSLYAMAGVFIIAMAPVAEVLVKNAQVAAAAWGEPGHGMAGRQVSETNVRSMEFSSVISLVLILVFAVIAVFITNEIYEVDGFRQVQVMDYWAMIAAAIAGLIVSVATGFLMARRCNRVFGMVNGDILGATNEISRITVMAVMILVYMVVV